MTIARRMSGKKSIFVKEKLFSTQLKIAHNSWHQCRIRAHLSSKSGSFCSKNPQEECKKSRSEIVLV